MKFQLPPIPKPRTFPAVTEVQPGQLLSLPTSGMIHWLVLQNHPDDADLWLVAPVDTLTWEGPMDLGIPAENGEPPYTVRLWYTVWISAQMIRTSGRLYKTFPDDVVRYSRDILLRAVRGELIPLEEQLMVADDPDYLEWVDDVMSALESLKSADRGEDI